MTDLTNQDWVEAPDRGICEGDFLRTNQNNNRQEVIWPAWDYIKVDQLSIGSYQQENQFADFLHECITTIFQWKSWMSLRLHFVAPINLIK